MTAAEDITTPDGTVRAEKGTVVATLTTDDKGKAETDKLYLGKYVIKETKAPEGYLLNPKEFEVTLAYKDQTTEIVYGDVTVPDQPAKGKIRITKTDAETNKPIPLGAEFTVTAAEDITTPDGTVRAEKGTVVATLTTDDKGKAETDKLYLGKYVIKETKAPEGYLLNPKEFEVTLAYKDQTTEIVYGDVTVPNQPAKGQIEILKKDEETGNLLSGAEFTVTAAEDITTPDGTVRAEKGTVVDTIVTDTTGIARSKELYLGKYVVKETKQPIGFIRPNQTWDVELKYADQKTELVKENLTIKNQPTEIIIDKKETGTDKPLEGVKFVIWNKDKEDPIDPGMQHKEIYTTDANGKIRLLYLEPGNYAVAEVESIPGYAWDDKMIYEFTITEDGRVDGEVSHTIPVGNDRTEITETNAINVSTGTQDAFAVDLTIIDTVSIVNLMPNREYKLQLILADAKTGEPLKVKDQPSGDLLTTEKTFTADSSKMDVDMQIEFDASPFVGRTIVAYEYLYQDGVEISRHEDPNDKKQQIYVKDKLKLNTTAIDLISGTHEAIAKKDVTIRDNVDHFGLIKGNLITLDNIKNTIEHVIYTFGSILDGYTTIENILDEQIICYDISDLSQMKAEIFDVVIFNVISLCWDNCVANGIRINQMEYEGKIEKWDKVKTLILIDEAHRWVNTKKEHALDLVTKYLREARKYNGGITLARLDFSVRCANRRRTEKKRIFQIVWR